MDQQHQHRDRRLTMDNMKRFVGTAAVFVVLGLALAAPKAAAADRLHIAMMDDDMMKMKPDSSNSNMGQSSGQSQNMGGGRTDDKMKMQMPQGGPMQQPGQVQDCQGSGCQQGSNMMQMMERMHSRMNAPSGAGSSSDATASGPADVTERLEGRI